MKKTSSLWRIIDFIIMIFLIFSDQISKYFISTKMVEGQEIQIFHNNIFVIQYLKNYGAAFGILQNRRVAFIFFTAILLSIILFFYFKVPMDRKYIAMRGLFIVLTAGAIGNFIDRVSHVYVIDFLYFKLINFPIFNFADCYVVIGAALAIILFFFIYKEEDLIIFKLKK